MYYDIRPLSILMHYDIRPLSIPIDESSKRISWSYVRFEFYSDYHLLW
jgi:hypothetical protein